MKQREGRLEYGPDEQYLLRGLPVEEGDALDVLAGNIWVSGYVHYEESDGNWYCDAGVMSIPLYDGREARFRLETVHRTEGDQGALTADDWDESEEAEEWDTEEIEDEQEE